MIQSISLIISYFVECIILIYYTNSTFQARKSYLYSNIGIVIGHLLLYAISLLYIPNINLIAFVVVNAILIYSCFKTKLKNAVIEAIILTAVMMISEGVISMFTNIDYESGLLAVSINARVIHAVFSKLIYFVGVIINKYISKDRKKYDSTDGFFSLMIIPVFTIISIISIVSIFEYIDEKQRMAFSLVAVLGIVANVIVYWIYDKTLRYHQEISELQEQKYKNELELTYCNMLEEKLSNTQIMRHDFKEHLRILEAYIEDDHSRAISYLKSIDMINDEISVLKYADSKILNILLSEKQKLCARKGIDLKIQTSKLNFEFMKDIDIVSIFSNLLNNAIESSEQSEGKFIHVNLYKMNDAFLVIKIENSCDKKPVENNGFYKTTKLSSGEHGIGLKSVAKALKEYNGDLRMQYSEEEHCFTAMIMIPLK